MTIICILNLPQVLRRACDTEDPRYVSYPMSCLAGRGAVFLICKVWNPAVQQTNNLMTNITDQYQAVWNALNALPDREVYFALLMGLPLSVALLLLHEVGHWLAAKIMGVSGRIVLFPRRHNMKLWWLAVLGVYFEDGSFGRLHQLQRSIVALAGPTVDIALGIVGLLYGMAVPGPHWVGISLAGTCGLLIAVSMTMNLVPMRYLRNDGWVALGGAPASQASICRASPPAES